MLALIVEMANPNDNMDDAMMDLINSGANQDSQGEDDGSQYFADYEELVGYVTRYSKRDDVSVSDTRRVRGYEYSDTPF